MIRVRRLLLGLLFLILVASLSLAANETSPLSDVVFTWQTNETIGLPWYPVSQDDVETCSRGLTSTISQKPSNHIIGASLDTPIYRDTVTILAQKSVYDEETYYEIGWYFQPFEGSYKAKVILADNFGVEKVLKEGSVTAASSFSDYQAFAMPCDPDVTTCLDLSDHLSRVTLEWWSVNGSSEGPHQYLVSSFVKLNETNQ